MRTQNVPGAFTTCGTSAVKSFTPEGAFIADFVTSGLGGLSQPAAVVVRLDEVNINPGMADAWFDPSTAGQGFLITVFPDREELFVAWFTYDTERPPENVTQGTAGPAVNGLGAQRALRPRARKDGGRGDGPLRRDPCKGRPP